MIVGPAADCPPCVPCSNNCSCCAKFARFDPTNPIKAGLNTTGNAGNFSGGFGPDDIEGPTCPGPGFDDCDHTTGVYSHWLSWGDVQPTDGGTITTPQVIDLAGAVDITLSTENGGVERRTSGTSYSGDFCTDEPLAFFRSLSPGPAAPGGPGVMEFSPGICAIGFTVQQDAASLRDDYFIEVWLDGVAGPSFTGLVVDSSSPGLATAQHFGVSIQGNTTKRITKIRFGFAGGTGLAPDPNIPFAIGSLGVCV